MSAINIKGINVSACYGVLESEKTQPQPFVFDVAIDVDIFEAAKSDDVAHTINYATVCEMVADYCKSNSFNLIERLAYGEATNIMLSFPAAHSVEVTVHKPLAPVPLEFDDVSVTVRVERNKVVLSLGSSEGDREQILKSALSRLAEAEGIELLKTSDFIYTQPYGGVAKNTFCNCAALIECLLTPKELLNVLHGIEAEAGRVRSVRWGDRTLDMDIIFFGDKIINGDGLCVPHPDYANRDFVLVPIKEIVPEFVCPYRHKRVADM